MDKDFLSGNQRKYLILILVIVGVYVFMKFLSPILSPFILAFLFAGLLSKLTGKIPLKIKKSVLAGFILLIGIIFFVIAVWLLGGVLIQKCSELAGQLTVYEEELCGLLGNCCNRLETSFGIDGAAMENYVLEQVNIFVENMEVKILPAVMNKSMSYFKNMAGIIGFFAVCIIAVFLILKDYDKILTHIKENEDFKGILEVAGKVCLYLKTYVRAQLTILFIISSICAVTLGVLGIKGGIIYGVFTGFMDMLPFIGTGIMLMPLAFLQLLSEHYLRAAVVVCLYGACALIREFLEPKLIGDKVGIWPVGILFSVFAGMKLFGIFGIIKGPIGLVLIFETYKYLFGEGKEAC